MSINYEYKQELNSKNNLESAVMDVKHEISDSSAAFYRIGEKFNKFSNALFELEASNSDKRTAEQKKGALRDAMIQLHDLEASKSAQERLIYQEKIKPFLTSYGEALELLAHDTSGYKTPYEVLCVSQTNTSKSGTISR